LSCGLRVEFFHTDKEPGDIWDAQVAQNCRGPSGALNFFRRGPPMGRSRMSATQKQSRTFKTRKWGVAILKGWSLVY